MLTPDKRQQLTEWFEKQGEAAIREWVAAGSPSPAKAAHAQAWLDEQHAKREAAKRAEEVALNKERNELAAQANEIAEEALNEARIANRNAARANARAGRANLVAAGSLLLALAALLIPIVFWKSPA